MLHHEDLRSNYHRIAVREVAAEGSVSIVPVGEHDVIPRLRAVINAGQVRCRRIQDVDGGRDRFIFRETAWWLRGGGGGLPDLELTPTTT
jgi:hypothetical protein